MSFPAKYPSLNATELTGEAQKILERIIRVAFPHAKFPDSAYHRMVDRVVAEADSSTWFRVVLTQGLLTLDAQSEKHFTDLPDDRALAVLRRIADLEFFGFIRRTTVLSMYDDPDVWEVLGYQGESFSKGGYLERGFDDLDWLPSPRIEESEEDLVEIGPLPYPVAAATVPYTSAGSAAAKAAGPDTAAGSKATANKTTGGTQS